MPKIFPSLKDIFKKEIEKKIEPGEATGNLLNGLFVFFRDTFKQRINSYCQNALNRYNEREANLSKDTLFANIDLEWVEQEKEFAEKEVNRISEENYIRFLIRKGGFEIPKSTIESIIAGDQETFNRLYEKEFPAVVRHVLANSGTLDEARDLFQDALVVLVEIAKNKRLTINKHGIEKYLFEIARRLWYNQLRKKKATKELNDNTLVIGGMEVEIEFYTEPDKYGDILTEIEKLGSRCKELLYHFYYLNRDWKDITEELGYISEASARNQKYKCLEKIRKNLNNKS